MHHCYRSIVLLAVAGIINAAPQYFDQVGQPPNWLGKQPSAQVAVESTKQNACLPPACCPPNQPDCDKLKVTLTTFKNDTQPLPLPEPSFRNAFSNNSMNNNVNFLAKAGPNLKFRLPEEKPTIVPAPSIVTMPSVLPNPSTMPIPSNEPIPIPSNEPIPIPTMVPTTAVPEVPAALEGCWTQACWQANPCYTRQCVQARITFMSSPAYKGIRRSPTKQATQDRSLFAQQNVQQLIGPESSNNNLKQNSTFKGIVQSIAYQVPGREPTTTQTPCIEGSKNCNVRVNFQAAPANSFMPAFGNENAPPVVGPDFTDAFNNNGMTNNVNFYAEEGAAVEYGVGPAEPTKPQLFSGAVNINGEPDWWSLLGTSDYQELIAQLGLMGQSAKEQINLLMQSGASPQDIAMALGKPMKPEPVKPEPTKPSPTEE